jgi:SAM-dependent methyltransferase
MFFPEKIASIKPGDRVLEVGPGGTPFPRSNVLLEKIFDDKNEAFHQRGCAPELNTNKSVVFYSGDRFPFKDKEFDYVVCSHVLEHVDDVPGFCAELTRVSKAGYLEFPTVYYDYMYDFSVHQNFLFFKLGKILWMKKNESELPKFSFIQKFFYQTLAKGHEDLPANLKEYFFQGFEWFDDLRVEHEKDLRLFCYEDEEINRIPAVRPKKISLFTRLGYKVNQALSRGHTTGR